jgi:two-component system, OmpR family, phosphate regulon response regulator OmpR
VLSRETLCKSIGAAVNERAIDVQVTRLRRKIEPDPSFPRYLRTVRGQGYRLVDA